MQMLQLSSLLELQALRLWYDALRVLQGTLCGSATSGLRSILESFFGVEKNIKEKRMAEAQSLQHLLKVQKWKIFVRRVMRILKLRSIQLF